MDQMELRWTEIRFYQICIDVYKVRNNIMDVMDFIDFISTYTNLQSNKYKMLANEVLNSYRIQPTREELVILCHHFKVPIRTLKNKLKIHNKTIYRIVNENKENPRNFYPRLSPQKIEEIAEFVNAVDIFKQIGV